MNEHDADIERAQDRYIQQNVREILVRDDSPIHADDEDFFTELRDVLENSAEISQFHFF